jgi:hypothetical protein
VVGDEDEDLDERTRDSLSGNDARRQITPERLRRLEARVAAKRQLGKDRPPLFHGEQLPQSKIMQRLAANSTWHTKDVEDTKLESLTGLRAGFTVRMMRHPDGAIAHLHFVQVIDELYRLVRWDADDTRDPWHRK